MTQSAGFKPVAAKNARILILGSLPGEESLRQHRYYAKRANGFWPIMSALTGMPDDLDYKNRLSYLKHHRVALWDVCASAFRVGSLDANIELSSIVPNDFEAFLNLIPLFLISFSMVSPRRAFMKSWCSELYRRGRTRFREPHCRRQVRRMRA